MAEASMNFDTSGVRPFLERLEDLLEDGFGDPEIQDVMEVIDSLAVDDETEVKYDITFAGEELPLRIRIYMEDIDSPAIAFVTAPDLADRIQEEMAEYAEELGH
jgi:uncharacterized protein Smg (DUF494 family)